MMVLRRKNIQAQQIQSVCQHMPGTDIPLFRIRYKVDESRDQGKLKTKPTSNNYVIKEEISIPIRKMINSNCNI